MDAVRDELGDDPTIDITTSRPSCARSAATSATAWSGDSKVELFHVRSSGVSVRDATYFLIAFISSA